MASTTFLQQAYLAYFGRPADVSGLSFYADKTEAQVVAAFSASPESQAFFGSLNTLAQINTIYQNLFNRPAEPAGLTYWSGEINAGRLSLAQASMGILNGAQNADKIAVSNKLAASTAFTAALDTTDEMIGYQGTAVITSARAFLASVSSDAATLTAATSTTALNATVAATVAAGSSASVAGQTFTLTTSVDTSGTLVGSAGTTSTTGSDTFNASNAAGTAAGQTLSTGDTLAGGSGVDTLNATIAVNVALSNVSGIELVNITDVAGATTSLLGSTGITSITSNASTTATTFSNIASTSVGLGVKNSTVGAEFQFATAAVAGAADSATLTVSNQTGGTNTIAGVETLNVVSTGGANTVTTLTAAAATTINISGDTAFTLTNGNTVATTINSTNSAGVTLTSNNAVAVTISGGAGNDSLTLTEGAAANNNVSGGAGDDTVTFTANLDATDTVAGGDGVDTLVALSVDLAGVTYTRVSGFERLQVSNALAGDIITANVNAGVERVNLAAATGGNTITFEAGAKTLALAVAAGAGLVVADTGSATTDSITLLNSSAATDV